MIGLLIGQCLVWIAGSACVALMWRKAAADGSRTGGNRAIILGYGYPVGTILLTVWMRGLSFAGIQWGWLSIGLPFLVFAAMALLRIPVAERNALFRFARIRGDDVAIAGASTRMSVVVWWALFGLICAHLVLAAVEIAWRPVFPWDAWTQWATKTRVWYEMLRMVPFSDLATWLNGNTYIDAAPAYPATLPLLQVWACIALGSWDDTLMNLPYVLFAASLSIAIYGQMQYGRRGGLLSIAAAYAVVSLPMLDTHVALAGYADFPLAVFYSLSAIALWQWAVSRDRRQFALAILLAVACPLTKNPGWAWLATLLPVFVVALLPKRGLWIVGVASAAALVVTMVFGQGDLTFMSYRIRGTYNPVWEPLWQNYFEFANWHLLWYLLPALMICNARTLLRPPLVAGTLLILSGLAFLFIVFSFSNAAAWVSDYSTVNRATLHMAPLMVFYLFSLMRMPSKGTPASLRSVVTAATRG